MINPNDIKAGMVLGQADAEMLREAINRLNRLELAGMKAREGWQLVPVEPTDEMLSAALKFPAQTRKQYAAMLTAAPKPSTD